MNVCAVILEAATQVYTSEFQPKVLSPSVPKFGRLVVPMFAHDLVWPHLQLPEMSRLWSQDCVSYISSGHILLMSVTAWR